MDRCRSRLPALANRTPGAARTLRRSKEPNHETRTCPATRGPAIAAPAAVHHRNRPRQSPRCGGRLEQPRSRSCRGLLPDSEWRNRDTFIQGRDQIRAFLQNKWNREFDYRLAKSLWGFRENRIAVRFQYEVACRPQLVPRYGNDWFDEDGLMRRAASINDVPIAPDDRRFHWPRPGRRPTDHEGIANVF